jgi:uncharacterized membrane protein YvbJ
MLIPITIFIALLILIGILNNFDNQLTKLEKRLELLEKRITKQS